jgi:hypothetical protein
MKGKAWGSLTLLLLIAIAGCATWIAISGIAADHSDLRWQFVVVAVILVGLCIVAGILVNGRPAGILIDDRNRMSLERVQWVAWIIVLLGAYFVEAIWNVAHGGSFPDMQPELFGLLGIVSGSAVVSNIVVDAKKRSPAMPPDQQATQPLAAGDSPGQKGLMDINYNVGDASWADLYLGEEAANRYVVDVSRLQKLIITVLLVFGYLMYLWATFAPKGTIAAAAGTPDLLSMPQIGGTFLTLLGVSHGAYLAYKATPKTPS